MAFTKETFNTITQLADDIFESQPGSAQSVAAIRTETPKINLNETQPGLAYPVQEVNAVRSGGFRGGRGGRGNRGGRGGQQSGGQTGQSSSSSSSSTGQGPKHPDLPPGEWHGCKMHRKFGRSAYFCAEPATCPWKNIYTERPAK